MVPTGGGGGGSLVPSGSASPVWDGTRSFSEDSRSDYGGDTVPTEDVYTVKEVRTSIE